MVHPYVSDHLAEVFSTAALYIQCAEYPSAGHVTRQSDTFELDGALNWNTPICDECFKQQYIRTNFAKSSDVCCCHRVKIYSRTIDIITDVRSKEKNITNNLATI